MKEIREYINLIESIDFKGSASGSQDAENTDHTFDEAVDYIKSNYQFVKKYKVNRIEPGFRAMKKSPSGTGEMEVHAGILQKAYERVKTINSTVDYLELKNNPYMSGSKQVSASLGYSWFTLENKAIGFLYYQDRGMGHDEIIIGANDKEILNSFYDTLVDFGVIKYSKGVRDIKENKSSDLYHGTNLDNAVSILQSNTLFRGDGTHGDEGAVSLTRSFGVAWNAAQWADPLGVVFVLDQLRLASTLGKKLKPFDWRGGSDEQEESSTIDIPNISNYIKQIIVLWRDGANDLDAYADVLNNSKTIVVNQDDFTEKTTGRQFLMYLQKKRK